ncbi:MAG: GNAT family N-acetyltransferase [Bacteroidales bacterium]|nr:GNAT family N-acetyltransferase [Bacteroidales bacterium]MCF8392056.1 GNAT family N-acetyltransferase [Bacteroidales bacterium]
MVYNDFLIRQATANDIPFLVDTIIEAEKSGTSTLTYTTIFGLSETDAREYIIKMLEEEIDGCELSVSGFILAEKDGQIAGAVGAWVEGSEGTPSAILKGNLLAYVLPSSCLKRASRLNNIIRDLHIEYVTGSIQIGLVYVALEARGKGLVSALIDYKIDLLKKKFPKTNKAYIQVFGNNLPAIRAYEKASFKIVFQKKASYSETAEFMPDIIKVLMKRNI